MRAPSFMTRQEGEAWIVTPAKESILSRARDPIWPPGRAVHPAADARAFPDHLYQWEGFSPPPEDTAEPYTLQWFLAIEHERHVRHARWIPDLLEFARHRGETLVGLGNGLGTDWLQFARHEAKVIACSRWAPELALIRRNFELRGLNGRFIHAEPTDLPLPDAAADVVCVSGLLQDVLDPAPIVREIFRILKPGGKVLAVVPAKYSIDYYQKYLFPWHRTASLLVGQSPWGAVPLPDGAIRAFSGRRLKRLFGRFANHRIHQRQLRRREAPWVLRLLPRKLLERWFGRFLILKAFKPIHALSSSRVAA